ncbi:unnamed protein product [Adineta steineri]|uniref:Uncharacterized protein n=1 Tax=Adineta steineri TaxID=433720 RepID=A0A819NXF0_9BILA|nr:unnamed protein product [Adineta steineri]
MEWHDPQESGCDLQLMTSCRDTPPIQTMSRETCLGQILGSLPLSICQTIVLPPSQFFVQQLRDNLYVTSSPEPLHCLNIPQTEYSVIRQQSWNKNEELVLSPVALVNVTPGYTIACPGFTLVGRAIPSIAPSLVILYNNSLLTNNISVVDVYPYLKENTTWFNTKPGELRMDALFKRIHEPFTVPITKIFEPSQTWSPLLTPLTALHYNSMPIQTKSNVFKQQQWQGHGSCYQQHLQPLMSLECDPSFHQNYRTMPYLVPLMSLQHHC